jgi:hypothetical protein
VSRESIAVREALLGEMLLDVESLLRRLEQLDASLAGKLEQGTKDAIGRALLSTKLNFTSMVDEQERKLIQAGRHAAAMIGVELNGRISRIVAVTDALERKARQILLILAGLMLVCGAIGGFVGAWLITVT